MRQDTPLKKQTNNANFYGNKNRVTKQDAVIVKDFNNKTRIHRGEILAKKQNLQDYSL